MTENIMVIAVGFASVGIGVYLALLAMELMLRCINWITGTRQVPSESSQQQ